MNNKVISKCMMKRQPGDKRHAPFLMSYRPVLSSLGRSFSVFVSSTCLPSLSPSSSLSQHQKMCKPPSTSYGSTSTTTVPYHGDGVLEAPTSNDTTKTLYSSHPRENDDLIYTTTPSTKLAVEIAESRAYICGVSLLVAGTTVIYLLRGGLDHHPSLQTAGELARVSGTIVYSQTLLPGEMSPSTILNFVCFRASGTAVCVLNTVDSPPQTAEQQRKNRHGRRLTDPSE